MNNFNLYNSIIIIFLGLLLPKILFSQVNEQSAATHLAETLAKVKFINCNFTQSVTNKSGMVLQEQTGVVKLKKPNLLNWQVLTPDRLSIIIDGEKIWHYDADLEQITVKKFTTELREHPIIKLLLGDLQRTLTKFKVSYASNNDCNADLCFVLYNNIEDVAQSSNINFIECYLSFNSKNQLILLKLIDELEQETVFNFAKFKNHVNSKDFKFIVPKGIDIIEE